MAPVILALRADPAFDVRVLLTAQHRELADSALSFFGITGDIDLDLMRAGQQLDEFVGRCMLEIGSVYRREQPDWVIAQGDTSTVLVAALAAFFNRLRFAHVEAGLRTHSFSNPFPEEMNRTFADRLSTLHFAPTQGAAKNLRDEGIPDASIVVTGNTVIDALYQARAKIDPSKLVSDRSVLITLHRRESFGEPLTRICAAVRSLSAAFPDTRFIWPVHPNPVVRDAVELLRDRPNVELCEPFGYEDFVQALSRARLALTDSGGIQEEAPAIGIPVLVARETTERPEAIAQGSARLVGSNVEAITREVSRLLLDDAVHREMAIGVSPYGDGRAAERIRSALLNAKAI